MPEFNIVDSFQVTMTGNVDTIDASARGGSSVTLKNPTGNSAVYIGPATNEAGSALASTTGYLLAAGETLSLDLNLGSADQPAARRLSCKGTNTEKLHVIVLKP